MLRKWFDYLRNSVFLDTSIRVRTSITDNHLDIRDYLDSNGINDINNFFEEYNFDRSMEYSANSKGSKVNRFSNEKPREAQNIEKMYNSGVFGGKPVYTHEKTCI